MPPLSLFSMSCILSTTPFLHNGRDLQLCGIYGTVYGIFYMGMLPMADRDRRLFWRLVPDEGANRILCMESYIKKK